MKRHYSDTCVPSIGIRRNKAYDPIRREDLVINRNRIKELSDWINNAVSVPRASLLLLCGPPGCGKATCVRVLAVERGIEVVDWTTPVDSYEFSNDDEYMKPVSVANKFKSFLLGVGRYTSVVQNKNISSTSSRLIVVKDFPTCFLTSPDQFTEIIDYYVVHGHTPIIFICTESTKKKSKDIAYELFNEVFKLKHHIVQLSFLPIPVTSVIKALKLIAQLSHISVGDEVIREISIESRGDIRKAMNDMNILSVNAKLNKCTSSKRQSKSQNKNKSVKDVDRETTGLFHSVGRVLYAKRDSSNDGSSQKEDKSYSDPRGELIHKPLDIAKEFSHYSSQFVSLAHSNYLDIFSSIECIARAAEYLSDSDIIMSEWREKELLSTTGFSVAVSGLMECNNDPIRRWKPLKGSQWNDDLKIATINRVSVEYLLSDYCVSKCAAILEVVPSMTRMWCSRNKESRLTKWCPNGFLPHRTEDLLSVLRKIKSDILICPPLLSEGNKSDCDSSVHISEDSD